jgi:aminoglycoside phosphotransferase (APT) family kinase protein
VPADARPPGPLIAEGRAARVYDIGGGWLLRRYRDLTQDATAEAAVMRLAGEHGVRVPVVRDVHGPDLVIERIEGRSMLSDLLLDPGSCAAHGRTLAQLHHRLDGVSVPEGAGLRIPTGRPGRLLHGDLHPDNVLLSADGPVLIDWSNAATGPSSYDTATTWLVLACFAHRDTEVDARLARVRTPLIEALLAGIDRTAACESMALVATHRIGDPATSAGERARIRAFAAGLTGVQAD